MKDAENFSYHLPTRITFGSGSRKRLTGEIASVAPRGVLLCASPGLKRRHPDLVREIEALPGVLTLDEIGPNPGVTDMEAYREKMRGRSVAAIVGIGGGSVLDTARVLSATLTTKAPLRELVSRPDGNLRRLPLILVPTTSGTASEVTPWATVWDFEERRKLSLAHPNLYADRAVIDPELMVGMPARLTAQTGMDTMSHAIESLWARGATPPTRLFSAEAIRLVLRHLPEAVEKPDLLEPRIGMAQACLIAGMAFSQTRTAAAHGISYPMTLFHGVPHGIACSITLPILILENAKRAPEPMKAVTEAFGCRSPQEASGKLSSLMDRIGIPRRLSELGIGREDLERIRKNSFTGGRMDNNICVLGEAELREILDAIY